MNNYNKSRYLRPLSTEMQAVDLGDKRLNTRLRLLIDDIARNAGKSIPKACGAESKREAAYRFFNNESADSCEILEPHIVETCNRAARLEEVLVVHDTTICEFSTVSPREGLGWIRSSKNERGGFLGHFSLVVSADGRRMPLGVIGVESLIRKGQPKKNRSKSIAARRKDKNRESLRWGRAIAQAESRLGSTKRIHITDREGDSYEIFSPLVVAGIRFVGRVAHDRKLHVTQPGEEQKLFDAIDKAEPLFTREVELSARRTSKHKKTRSIHPARRKRKATLSFSATTVTVKRAKDLDSSFVGYVTLNVVRAIELNVPEGEEPVEWILITTEPIQTKDQIEKIVDSYRARWVIEEYFKSLKTGCGYEKLQLESKKTLLTALAVMIPVAWRLLLLRSLGRNEPNASASLALTPTQIQILRTMTNEKLSESPTIQQAMMAVARLGGHIKNNGDPGWIVLGRGFNDLLLLETGWLAAKGKM